MINVDAALLALREVGFAMLDPLDDVERVQSYFDGCPVYVDAHMPETARRRGELPVIRSMTSASECVCTPMVSVICAPELLERGVECIRLAQVYLNTHTPLAYSMNMFTTRPGPAGTRPDIQEFHRDEDDPLGFMAIFFYLSDVLSDEDGPHELKGPDGVARRVYGPAGTCFVADTRNEHRGIKPTRGERGIAWVRWGVSDPPPSYVWDRNEPIPASLLGARFPREAAPLLKLLIDPSC